MYQSENKWPKGDFTVSRIAERYINIESKKSALAKPKGGQRSADEAFGYARTAALRGAKHLFRMEIVQTETSR